MSKRGSHNGHGGARAGAGRKPKPIEDRVTFAGKIAIRIDEETALGLQQLMLREAPGVSTPEQMVKHLVLQELQKVEVE